MASSSSSLDLDLNLPSDPEEEEEDEIKVDSASSSPSSEDEGDEGDSTASFFSDSEASDSASSSTEDEVETERPTPFPKVIPLVATAVQDAIPTLKPAETRTVLLKSIRMFFKTAATSFHVDFTDPFKSTEWAIVDLVSEDGTFKALEFFRITQDIIVRMNEQELQGHVVPLHTQTVTVFQSPLDEGKDETAVANIVFKLDQTVGKTETYSAPCTANHQMYVNILRVAENMFKIAKIVIITPPPPRFHDSHDDHLPFPSLSSSDDGGEGNEGGVKNTAPVEEEEESDDITLSDIDGMF